MVKIELIEIGDTYPVDYHKLITKSNKSLIFSVGHRHKTCPNPPLLNREDSFMLQDEDFNFLLAELRNEGFTIAIVNRPLTGNFFSRRISDKLIVVSIFNIDALSINDGITLEMYIMRFMYSFATIYLAYNNILPDGSVVLNELMQRNTKGCLFDLCQYRPQVATFFRKPQISREALSLLQTKLLPNDFLPKLEKEIKSLKISRYYTMKDWLKENPISSIIITFIVGFIFSELLGNYLYDLIRHYLPFLK